MKVSRGLLVLAVGLLSACDGAAPDVAEEDVQVSTVENEREDDLATRFRAAIHGPSAIRFTLEGAERPDSVSAYRLTDGTGAEIPIADLRLEGEAGALVVPEAPVDPMRVHYLEIPESGLRALVRRDPLFREIHSDKALGAVVSDGGATTTFRVFAPRATGVRLYLYADRNDGSERALEVIEMEVDRDGVWEATQDGDLRGRWYDFTVHGPADPGNWFWETHPVHISDPYALVNDDSHGKSLVWRDGPPPPPVVGGRPAMEDVVAYEVHVQDFTDLLPVGELETGTLPAMARPGLTNAQGEPIGFDYLVDLGVNVVHLMPVQEFLHYPDDEWQAVFAQDSFAQAMGIDRENYQWGYRTTHSFAVESRYRSRDAEPGVEREQFKQAMEKIGLSVCRGETVRTIEEARRVLDEIGCPCVVRPSFTMGGSGSAIAYNRDEFDVLVRRGLDQSPVTEVLIEESIIGWKEYEMEVMRDLDDNVVIICSIENFDAMGVHTGDSITVAPAQTLTDLEYQEMRDAAIAIIREIGVEAGGCNIQFAVSPETGELLVVEMNPRVSRSSGTRRLRAR